MVAPTDPMWYRRGGAYEVNTDVEDIYLKWDNMIPTEQLPAFQEMAAFLVEEQPRTERELADAMIRMRRRFKCVPKRSQVGHALAMLEVQGACPPQPLLRQLLVKKAGKSQSGVLVVTVLTSPHPSFGPPEDRKTQRFSCKWNCYYCPNEPGQPRSYLHDEPSVLRANQNGFDPVLQFTERVSSLAMNGHPADKIELLVLGGTWSSYPHEYQEEFCRDLFYAANTFGRRGGGAAQRQRGTLEEEQRANEDASCKIIGLTLETRPDEIDGAELRRLRRYGCTRVQLGVQHTDDAILRKINRGCTTADTARALRLLKDACYKVDIHLMPNLPGADVETDRAMFERVLGDEALQADQWKIYPCEVTPWTVIKRWHDSGEYVPYDEPALCELLMDVKAQVHPWIRLNRVVRDIPSQYILGGIDAPNLRQQLLQRMALAGRVCRCIRCREVGADSEKMAPRAELVVRRYRASGGVEYFLSYEADGGKVILGFCRLRFSRGAGVVATDARSAAAAGDGAAAAPAVFEELRGAALIRELHVYGQLVATDDAAQPQHARGGGGGGGGADAASQHQGFGRKLLACAEQMARRRGYRRVAVISGVGTRQYYRRHGYELQRGGGGGDFMVKPLRMGAGWWLWSVVLELVMRLVGAATLLVSAPRAADGEGEGPLKPLMCVKS